jgi:predicted RNA polymerase sigma factor
MAQRLSRARSTLRDNGARFETPSADELPTRIAAVLDVLYLVFNEGYARSSGETLVETSLAQEAIRLTRQLHAYLPDHDEVAGALALMLLTDARRPARVDARGDLVPLAEQDRTRWDRGLIEEGVAILEAVLPRGHVGAYQLQAAIAAVHAEATRYEDTDWPQIVVLYSMLAEVAPSPAVTLNRAVAVGMVSGPTVGLEALEPLVDDPALARYHRVPAVRAHLLELAGDREAAEREYARAAELTSSRPEQRYLVRRLTRLREEGATRR